LATDEASVFSSCSTVKCRVAPAGSAAIAIRTGKIDLRIADLRPGISAMMRDSTNTPERLSCV